MLGLGGIRAEVDRDVVFRINPVDRQEIERIVLKLKGRALLEDFRGMAPVNLDLLAVLILCGVVPTFQAAEKLGQSDYPILRNS